MDMADFVRAKRTVIVAFSGPHQRVHHGRVVCALV